MTAPFEPPTPAILDVVERWHRYLGGDVPGRLDELLDDDGMLYSPVVYTPQAGNEIVTRYLTAAALTFPGDKAATALGHALHYTKQLFAADTAVLEFETSMAGKDVNGVDIIRINEHGRIVEFRVMVRPLQAVHAVHQHTGAALVSLGDPVTTSVTASLAPDTQATS